MAAKITNLAKDTYRGLAKDIFDSNAVGHDDFDKMGIVDDGSSIYGKADLRAQFLNAKVALKETPLDATFTQVQLDAMVAKLDAAYQAVLVEVQKRADNQLDEVKTQIGLPGAKAEAKLALAGDLSTLQIDNYKSALEAGATAVQGSLDDAKEYLDSTKYNALRTDLSKVVKEGVDAKAKQKLDEVLDVLNGTGTTAEKLNLTTDYSTTPISEYKTALETRTREVDAGLAAVKPFLTDAQKTDLQDTLKTAVKAGVEAKAEKMLLDLEAQIAKTGATVEQRLGIGQDLSKYTAEQYEKHLEAKVAEHEQGLKSISGYVSSSPTLMTKITTLQTELEQVKADAVAERKNEIAKREANSEVEALEKSFGSNELADKKLGLKSDITKLSDVEFNRQLANALQELNDKLRAYETADPTLSARITTLKSHIPSLETQAKDIRTPPVVLTITRDELNKLVDDVINPEKRSAFEILGLDREYTAKEIRNMRGPAAATAEELKLDAKIEQTYEDLKAKLEMGLDDQTRRVQSITLDKSVIQHDLTALKAQFDLIKDRDKRKVYAEKIEKAQERFAELEKAQKVSHYEFLDIKRDRYARENKYITTSGFNTDLAAKATALDTELQAIAQELPHLRDKVVALQTKVKAAQDTLDNEKLRKEYDKSNNLIKLNWLDERVEDLKAWWAKFITPGHGKRWSVGMGIASIIFSNAFLLTKGAAATMMPIAWPVIAAGFVVPLLLSARSKRRKSGAAKTKKA